MTPRARMSDERRIARLQQLLGCSALVGLGDRRRAHRGEAIEGGIAQRHRQREVTRAQRGELRHQRLARGPVDDVGEDDGEGPTPVALGEERERRRIVRLDERPLHRGERIEDAAQRAAPAGRRQIVLHTIGEDHQSDVVVVGDGGVRQLQRGLHHELQPGAPVVSRR